MTVSAPAIARTGSRVVLQPTRIELVTHAVVLSLVVICATILGADKALNSGDVLAIYTAAISGTAAVAGARAGNRNWRAQDIGDSNDERGPVVPLVTGNNPTPPPPY